MHAAGNDPRYRLVAVANQHFFALLHELDVSAELRFQVANVYGTHTHITTNLTMLLISSVGIPLRKTRSLDCSVERVYVPPGELGRILKQTQGPFTVFLTKWCEEPVTVGSRGPR